MVRFVALTLLSLATLAVASVVPAPAMPQKSSVRPTSAKVHAGQEIFSAKCMQCHAVHEGQYSFGPNLDGELRKPHPKKTPAQVTTVIREGKGKMPAFGEKLTRPEMDDLIAYLRTL